MPTLEAIQTKIKRLQEQAEAIKAKEATATLDRIIKLMQKSGVTVADIEAHIGGAKGGAGRSKLVAANRAPTTAKYQDPKTGATWSGRGRAPAWIANVKNRDRFLVDGNAVSTSTSAGGEARRKGNYVRGQRPAKYRHPKTGATWSGRGRAPAWIANAKDRSKFSVVAEEKAEATVKTTLRNAKSKASSTPTPRVRKGQPKGKQQAKYLNPETGATWSGRGPAPAWLAAADDRSKFLIDAAAIEAPTT